MLVNVIKKILRIFIENIQKTFYQSSLRKFYEEQFEEILKIFVLGI